MVSISFNVFCFVLFACFKKLFEVGLSLKATGDCLIIAPQFICEKKHIDEIIDKLRTGIVNYQKNQKNFKTRNSSLF